MASLRCLVGVVEQHHPYVRRGNAPDSDAIRPNRDVEKLCHLVSALTLRDVLQYDHRVGALLNSGHRGNGTENAFWSWRWGFRMDATRAAARGPIFAVPVSEVIFLSLPVRAFENL